MAIAELTRDQEEAHWAEICCGVRCCICEERFPPPYTRAFAYCLTCVPEAAEPPHKVSIHIDHHVEGFSAHVVCEEDPRWVYWMVCLSKDEVTTLLSKGRTAPFEREAGLRGLQQWGRTSMITHLDEDEYRMFHEAWKRDARTGYEKVQALERRRRSYCLPRLVEALASACFLHCFASFSFAASTIIKWNSSSRWAS